MGVKGDKMKQESVLMSELLLEKLNGLGDVSTKKMFGGHGVFHSKKMFGLINSKGQVYFKSDDTTQAFFESQGAKKHSKMPYYSVPNAVLNDLDALLEWSSKSIKLSK